MPATRQQTKPCSKCEASFFPNELHKIQIPGPPIKLCSDCVAILYTQLRDKHFVGKMVQGEMTMGEVVRIRRERAASYARREMEIA